MCGFAGIVCNFDDHGQAIKRFKESAGIIKHRGPDHTGIYENGRTCLVHHRLSILDPESRSNQPFSQKELGAVLVYNGELYNYLDLKRKFSLTTFTASDTEVIYKLLSSPNFDLKDLNGIFALALLDKSQSNIRLVRDRLGVKPLYYYWCEEFFMFASEAKVIYNYLLELNINHRVLSEYLTFGHSNSNETIIKGVKKVPPGSVLDFDIIDRKLEIQSYWSATQLAKDQGKPSYAVAKENTKRLLYDAIKRQCVSDVPIGAYLSGGIDSSAVVTIASQFTDKKLNTFSVKFDKNPISELKAAAEIARKAGTNHHEFEVTTNHIEDYLPHLIYQYDEPFADPAMIPLHLMAKKASGITKVVLQGDGGDEIFAGYGRHLDLLEYNKRKILFGILKKLPIGSVKKQYYKSRFESLNYQDVHKLFARLAGGDLKDNRYRYLADRLGSHLPKDEALHRYETSIHNYKDLPLMQRMLFTDMENILPNKFLEKVDKVNMLHSIEARVPLLDNELVEYVMSLPQKFKIQKSTTKYFFRDILEGVIPNDILNDRKKSFGTPINNWLITTLHEYAISKFKEGANAGLPLNFEALISKLKNIKLKKSNDGGVIWKYLVLTIWLLQYRQKLNFSSK